MATAEGQKIAQQLASGAFHVGISEISEVDDTTCKSVGLFLHKDSKGTSADFGERAAKILQEGYDWKILAEGESSESKLSIVEACRKEGVAASDWVVVWKVFVGKRYAIRLFQVSADFY